jgi:hypothetical protein
MTAHPSNHSQPDGVKRSTHYKPSLITTVSRWISKLPGSSSSYYLGIWLLLTLAQVISLLIEGATLLQTFQVAQIFMPATVAYMLGMLEYFDTRALGSMSQARTALTLDEESFKDFQYRLITLPVGWPLFSAITSIGILLISESIGATYRLEALAPFPISATAFRIIYLISWALFGVFVYQVLHRLTLINRLYSRHIQINLFRKQPLYAFSNLTAWMAVSLSVLPIGFLLTNNILDLSVLDPISIVFIVGIQVIAFSSFLLPQIGIQRLQRTEKDRLLDEVNQRFEHVFIKLHKRIDAGDLESTDDLSTTVSLLQKELDSVKEIPIWPWDPETLRWLISALVFPILIVVLQIFIQRIF